MKETPVSQHVLLAAGAASVVLWRNNVGAAQDATGRLVRYGLANDSEVMNRDIKSSDLIGITPIVITAEMLGRTIGIFTAIETKSSDWHMVPSDVRAHAQEAFHRIVQSYGGIAGFATSVDDFHRIVGR